jgi:hypothetical protein
MQRTRRERDLSLPNRIFTNFYVSILGWTLNMFSLSRFISSRTTLFNVLVEHYFSYKPNKLFVSPP